jgi:hypothetical protein
VCGCEGGRPCGLSADDLAGEQLEEMGTKHACGRGCGNDASSCVLRPRQQAKVLARMPCN